MRKFITDINACEIMLSKQLPADKGWFANYYPKVESRFVYTLNTQ